MLEAIGQMIVSGPVHAHRVLHRALERAAEHEILARNVAGVVSPPAMESDEIEILGAAEVVTVLRKPEGHALYSIVALDLASGLRRGELLTLPWLAACSRCG